MMAGPVLVIHLTQGSTWDGAKRTLDANRSWSHWLGDPATGKFKELVDPDRPARSLRNMTGGVQTNNRGDVYQIEVVGFSEHVHTYSDEWFAQLAHWVGLICDDYDIPRQFPYPFTGSDGYGLNGKVRLTNQQWLDVTGIVGHCHVPENTHWDPGRIDRLIPLVTGGGPTVAESNPDVLKLQTDLHTRGFDPGPRDGLYGPRTHAAYLAYTEASDRALAALDRVQVDERKVDAADRLVTALDDLKAAQ